MRHNSKNKFENSFRSCLAVFIIICIIVRAIFSGIYGIITLTILIGVIAIFAAISYMRQKQELRKREEEYKRSEDERLTRIADLTYRPLKDLSVDELSFLASEFGNDENGIEGFYLSAVRAGSRCAVELLVLQAERCNPKATPEETIAHCDEINNIIPNSMCYYRKGLALKDLEKTDEAIVELETAVSIDDTTHSETMKLTFGAREKITQILPSLRKLSRKRHIEKDGQYTLVKTGIEYEDFVYGVIRRMGYVCKKTPATDQGVDLVVSLKNGKKLAIQCKFLSVPVSNSAVQEVVAGKALYKCSHACVVGKSGYTRAAIKLAIANDVQLIQHDEIYDCICGLERI